MDLPDADYDNIKVEDLRPPTLYCTTEQPVMRSTKAETHSDDHDWCVATILLLFALLFIVKGRRT